MSNCTIPAAHNATTAANSEFAALEDIMSFMQVFVPFAAFLKLPDWLKLAVLGTVLETARRYLLSGWSDIKDSFFLSVHFDSEDDSFDWMMTWLARQPAFLKSRDVEVSTANNGTYVPGEEREAADDEERPLKYVPSPNAKYSLWFKNRWMHISRTKAEGGGDYWSRTKEDRLHISLLSRDHTILNALLLEAKKAWNEERETGVCVYVADQYDDWRCIATRPKRPIRSIILDPSVKNLLLEDARDFLSSKKWYAERGIPFRRGYLLYGQPGSGKTSLIQSIAGELDLDVYIVSLSRAGLDDNGLSNLVSALPPRCIALMEDIDAAFRTGITRDALPDDPPATDEKSDKDRPPNAANAPASGPAASKVTLSGLLNALDGIGAQEGRILFATTNRYSALDSALTRPGRMDLHIEFRHATSAQAEELFKYFYLPSEDDSADADAESEPDADVTVEPDLIDFGGEKAPMGELPPTPPLSPLSGSPARSFASVLPLPMPSTFSGTSHSARAPTLARSQYIALARRFGAAMPDGEFSMASLQGYLMAYKVRPLEAVRDLDAWIVKQREEKSKKAET